MARRLAARVPLPLAALAALVGLAVQAACNAFSLPSRECAADGMNQSFALSGGEDPCQVCLQARCCDVVGECQRLEGCAEAVKETHACVLDGGKPQVSEPLCVPRLRGTSDAGAATYACLRASCQAECGLPTCSFGPDVPSFLNGACDRCVESTCCEPVAACAGNRRCRAALDCVATRCAAEEAAVFAGTSDPSALERAACGATMAEDAGDELPCVRRCFDLFVPDDTPGVVSEDRDVRCDVARVLACGARSGCGAQCSAFFAAPSDAGTD